MAIEGIPSTAVEVKANPRTETVCRYRYFPPEGRVEIVTKVDRLEKPPEVVIKDRGFTSRLGGGVVYAGEILPLIDWKLAFWRCYSVTLGLTPRFGGLVISRHVDDFTPFHNLEILGLAGLSWESNSRFGIGLRTNF